MIRAFEARLQLWADELQQGCCTHFENLNEAKAVCPGVFDLSKFSRKVISIQNEFKNRFVTFRQHEEMFILFSNPVAVKPETADSAFQLELIDLQCNSALKSKFAATDIKDFYQQLPKETFPRLRDHAARILSLFASTYLCEQAFSAMTLVKNKFRSRLTDCNMYASLKVALAARYCWYCKEKQCPVSSSRM